ncbi:MAG: hypothetical protein LUE99_19250 [Bacteroides sp.]|nr:hypothetical protein [Bacteroides sp.]
MKTLDFVKIALLCVIALGFASCGDDNYYYTMKNSDEKLCGKTWVDEYTNEDGQLCKHQLKFTKERKNNQDVCLGQEITTVYLTGGTNTTTKDFTWKWLDAAMEGLALNYGAGETKYFEDVLVREHYLSGKLDGKMVSFSDTSNH